MFDKERFARFCEGLASPNPKERSVSAEKASALLAANGMTWDDLIALLPGVVDPSIGPSTDSKFGIKARKLIADLRKARNLGEYEREFIRALFARGASVHLTDTQWAIVMRIAVQNGLFFDEAVA